ncbi:MAG: aminopeptidase [Candidatus Aenigmarchaeota archaeon]|nr:aminopeptidase [Candidatus Aenigmarchaeota archaeon]
MERVEKKGKKMNLPLGAIIAVKQCMKIKKGESVLIITDEKMNVLLPRYIEEACKKQKAKTTVLQIKPLERNGQEPEKGIAKMMKEFEVEFLITSKSLSHTKARRQACKAGARIASMPGITEFSFVEGGLTADYNLVKRLCVKMFNKIKNANKFEIKSANGTELTMEIGDYVIDIDEGLYHKPGNFGNLPAGEVCTSPNDLSVNGIAVIDKMGRFGENIVLEIENSFVKNIQGEKLKKEVDEIGKKARIIAEVGIGTNPKAKIIGNVLEDEKVFGTMHIALGNNVSFGGKNKVQFHQDGIITKPTLIVDGKTIIKDGVWV